MRKILFLLVGSFSFISSVFAEGAMTSTGFMINLGQMDPVGASHAGATGFTSIFFILQEFSRLLLFMIPVIAIVSTLIAGYYYIFSAGDSEKANKAKTIIKWNIVAIVVALMSWSIIQLIASIFSN